ncbi:hypothetical protein FISHEDRAFT_19822, partial [Fistulina hepatica ATCC 64428]
MSWFQHLFSPSSSNQDARRGQAMSSTHEAFSLPTSSPTASVHPDAFNATLFTAHDDESGSLTPAYTYPPNRGSYAAGAYGYVSTSSRPASLLPMHHDQLHSPFPPSTSYPSLALTWNRIRAWLQREYPELGDTLNYGILPQDLEQIEMQLGFPLPAVVRESYLQVDGQEAESSAGCSEGLFFGLTFLPLEDVLEEWRFWREVDEDPTTGANSRLRDVMRSIPPGWIAREYSQRGWIPLIADRAGNYAGIDLSPGEGGTPGQVIVFGRDFDTKVVLWKGDGVDGWAKWLASFVDELESREGFEIGASAEGSEDSEDDVGYEGYFYGGTGRGQGDGSESGSGGGLRLTGEYKGWSVLEAWADRSVKKWHEAEIIDDSFVTQDQANAKNKATERVGLGMGMLDLTQGAAAEVPIPVIGEDMSQYPSAPGPSRSSSGAQKVVPPILQVTKPPAPAPLPVDLPTRDIIALPSPPESRHSFEDDDTELGRTQPVREAKRAQEPPLLSLATVSPVPRKATGVSSDVPDPLLISTAQSPSPPPDIPDLLADSAPALQTTPIQPSPIGPSTSELPSATDVKSPESPVDLSTPEGADPDVTIRLVGGGGTSGVITQE